MPANGFARDVAIIGGCGRVGLPLGIAFASRGLTVTLVDRIGTDVNCVNAGRMPFLEDLANEKLPLYRDLVTDKPVVDLWGLTGRPPIV